MAEGTGSGGARLLEVSGLAKSYGGRKAVAGIDFHIDEGETYGLLGPNGAGKSTTISMLAGLLAPDTGTVTVAGQRITAGSTKGKSAIGLVPQDLAIYPDLTPVENLRFFASLYGMSKKDATSRIDEVLEVVGLADRRKERAAKFSGGMKRRLNIGVGLLHGPRLLILDEPTVGVDPQSRNAILEAVETLSEQGLSVLYTTHYMEEAERLCDRVGIVDEGRMLAEGTQRELVRLVGEQDRLIVRVTGTVRDAVEKIRVLPTVTGVDVEQDTVSVLVGDSSAQLPAVMAALSEDGVHVESVDVRRPDLESVFLHLTGKGLRD
ncbi:ABC transporter ATP-binding protein [Saccharomonospora azurea]|uniref:ABC transporter ATP-binding protein n=1 Tax=Saccharomonospora azurea TaxID=40988 RepID=UPI00240A32A8|nr:ABC transporter ATP-binding protein [Saccharomonospora azurea]